jgi:hypothetical protein
MKSKSCKKEFDVIVRKRRNKDQTGDILLYCGYFNHHHCCHNYYAVKLIAIIILLLLTLLPLPPSLG